VRGAFHPGAPTVSGKLCSHTRAIVGIPQIYHFGQEGLHNILVIDLLGPSLEDLFDMCGRKFTIKTVCMAAKQMVRSSHPPLYTLLILELFIDHPRSNYP